MCVCVCVCVCVFVVIAPSPPCLACPVADIGALIPGITLTATPWLSSRCAYATYSWPSPNLWPMYTYSQCVPAVPHCVIGTGAEPPITPCHMLQDHLSDVEFVDASKLAYPGYQRPLSPENSNGRFSGYVASNMRSVGHCGRRAVHGRQVSSYAPTMQVQSESLWDLCSTIPRGDLCSKSNATAHCYAGT